MLLKGWLSPSQKFEYVNQLLSVGKWLKTYKSSTIIGNRFDFYRHISTQILVDAPITYLEFGVYKGDYIRNWSKINISPQSEFFGFDSFEGLPTDWDVFIRKLPKGHFGLDGVIPNFDDSRVQFLKGLFQDTLSRFSILFNPRTH